MRILKKIVKNYIIFPEQRFDIISIHLTSWKTTQNEMVTGIIEYNLTAMLGNHDFFFNPCRP